MKTELKAQDLRNGNYLNINGIIKPIIIYGDSFTFKLDEKNMNPLLSFNDERVKPIQLNEEILLKCGFDIVTEINDFTENYWNKQKDCSIDVETFITSNGIERLYRYVIYSSSNLGLKRTKSIIYLHQLQNLIYALKVEELTINL